MTSTARLRRRIEALPPIWGDFLVAGVAVGLFAGAVGGVSIALREAGSFAILVVGVGLMLVCAALAAHLTPPRVTDLLD